MEKFNISAERFRSHACATKNPTELEVANSKLETLFICLNMYSVEKEFVEYDKSMGYLG